MLKKSLLLMLFVALLAPWATAQNTHLVCNGTQTNSAVPIRNGNGTQTEFVYPASMLSDMDGGTITSVKFFYSTSTATYSSTATVYVEEVSTATMSSSAWCYNQNTATVVYQGTTLALANSEMTITFNTPYVYNGGNLCFNIWYSGSAPSVTSYGVSTDDYTSGYDWAITPPVSKPYSRAKYLPKAEFTYTPATGTCKKPTILEPTDVTASTATLRWTEKGSADSWILQYGTDSEFGAGTYTEVTSGFNTEASPTIVKAVEGLLDLTKYYVRVKSVCTPDTDESDWSNTINFTTKQNPVVVGDGWSDDFEAAECVWSLINNGQTNQWVLGTAAHTGAGTQALYVSNNGTANAYTNNSQSVVYATKLLTFTADKFTFEYNWMANGEGNYDYIHVWLAPATFEFTSGQFPNGATGSFNSYTSLVPEGWISLTGSGKLNGQSSWQSKSLTVNVPAGNWYVVFMWCNDTSTGSNPPAAVDNVTITRVACSYDVADLAHDPTSVTAHEATVNWTDGEPGSWQVAWSKDNSFPTANTQTEIVNTNTIDLENLDASSTYYVRARAFCGGEDYGSWCNAISFGTDCEALASLNENFDSHTGTNASYPTNNLPLCWNYLNDCSSTLYQGYPVIYNASSYSYSGSNHLRFYSHYSYPATEYAILPEIQNLNGKRVTFYARYFSTKTNLIVGVMTDFNDATTFQAVETIDDLTSSYKKYTVNFNEVTGSYIAFKMVGGDASYSYYHIYIDDIVVQQQPDCATPEDLAVTANSQTPEGATITWTAGDANSWIVEYKKSTEVTWTAIAEPVNTPTHTFTGLDYSTDYNARVKVNCTAGSGLTYPTDPVNFTTAIQYPAPKNLVVSNITDKTATLSWTPGYQETSWVVKYKKNADAEYTIAEPNPVTTNPTINLTALTGATSYDVQVFNSNNMETPLSQSKAFTTSFGVPFLEEFATSSIPSGWNQYSELLTPEVLNGTTPLSTGGAWTFNNTTVLGQYHTRLNIYGTTCKSWLLTPNIVLTANQSLNFNLALTDYSSISAIEFSEGQADDKFVVLITTNNGATWSILRQWDNAGSEYVYNNINYKGEEVYIDLAAYSGQTVRIAFYGESTIAVTGEDNDLHIDNVSIDNTPTCYRPTAVTYSNLTNHSATISWTPGEAGQSAWQMAYRKGETFYPTDPALDWSTITLVNINDNPTYTFDKTLDAASGYYFYVRANCGTTAEPDYSAWSKIVCDLTTEVAAPKPTTFAKTSVGPDWVELYWNAPAGDYLSGYGLYYSTTSTTPDPTEEALKTINDPAAYTAEAPYHFTGLSANTTYYFWIRANHEANVYSAWQAISGSYFTTPESCPKPTSLVASEPSPYSIKLSWTAGAEWQTSWVIAYSKTSGFDPEDTEACTYVNADTNPFVVPGLDSETPYYFRVKGNCSGTYGESAWNTTEATGTTLPACPAPTNIVASNITHTTADLTWTGYSDSYTVQKRTAAYEVAPFKEDFENATTFAANWTVLDNGDGDNAAYLIRTNEDYHDGSYGFQFSSYYGNSGDAFDQYLVSTELNVTGQLRFYYRSYNTSNTETFKVGYSTTTNEVLTDGVFTWSDEISCNSTSWTPYLLDLPAGVKYIAINYTSNWKFYLYVDDITIGAYEVPEGEWTDVTTTATDGSCTVDELTAGTKYDVRAKGNCGGEYSSAYTFTTLDESTKIFTKAGNWNVATNWAPNGVPTLTNDVIIKANVTIPNECVATANNISFQGTPTPTITIEDGGQLIHMNAGVTATVKKSIKGYSGAKDNYYLIGIPQDAYYGEIDPTTVQHMLDNDYDLYRFDGSKLGEEWRNYEVETFNLEGGGGYLYANSEDVTLSVSTELQRATDNVLSNYYYSLSYTTASTNPWNGWNLVSNPWAFSAYMYVAKDATGDIISSDFYRMGEKGLEPSSGLVAPWEAVFVEATEYDADVAIVYRQEQTSSKSALNMTVQQGNATADKARIRFGEGRGLKHLSLYDNSTMVYVPIDSKDYAVVYAEDYGELPVNFKAAENGNYTLSFTTEDVEFSYLHLIDHMTGNEVDLLQTPSYNFDAQYTDIAARFKLVFAKGNADMGDDFGFIDANGNLLVLGIDGTATLQVVDVTGRVLSSETFSGNYSQHINAAAGVYMLRLIQGNNSRTQKIVVK